MSLRPRCVGLLLAGVAAVFAPGCRRAAVPEAPKPDNRQVGQAVGAVLPSVGRVNAENDLRQVGQMYKAASVEAEKPLATLADLAAIGLQRDAPAIYKNFQDGRYALCRPTSSPGSSPSIMAYDRAAVTSNAAVVVVLMGDGSVQVMPAAQFQAALKAQGG